MAFRALVTVDGYDFPEPSAYSGLTSTLVDSSRNVEGVMIGSVVRPNVAKVEISWSYLTVEQWSNILKCFAHESGDKFVNKVDFFDQSAGGWVTRNMYVSDRKAGMWRRDPENGNVLGWTGCALSLVEV